MSIKHILLIDDDESDQRIFSMVLGSFGRGFTVKVLDDAAQALYQLETGEIAADYIFLDVNMPGMTGMEFLRELRKQALLTDTPVIVLSGMPNLEDMREARQLGVVDYVIKPSKYSELKIILSALLLSS